MTFSRSEQNPENLNSLASESEKSFKHLNVFQQFLIDSYRVIQEFNSYINIREMKTSVLYTNILYISFVHNSSKL